MSAVTDINALRADMRLASASGSRVLVVGGCGGIGRVFVRASLEAGLEVAVIDLPRAIDAHRPEAGVMVIPIDAATEQSVAGAFAQLETSWTGLDSLVNLAGSTISGGALTP